MGRLQETRWTITFLASFIMIGFHGVSAASEERRSTAGELFLMGGGSYGTGLGRPGGTVSAGAELLTGPMALGAEAGSILGSPFVSAYGGYHRRRAGLTPHVVAGVTLLSSDSPFLWNIGAGFTYPLGERIGFRLDVRDHLFFDDPGNHVLILRMGISIRFD